MKMCVLDFTGVKKYPDIEKYEGLGASDRAIVELVKWLASFGHEVVFYNNCSKTGIHEGVKWENHLVEDECDVLIMQRLAFGHEKIKYKKMIFYMHDDLDAPVMKNFDQFISYPDHFLVLSTYHKHKLMAWGIQENKISIVPEGVDTNFRHGKHELEEEKSLVYASAPFKGLPLLLKLWKEIRERVPDVKLKIVGDMGLYQASQQNFHFQELWDVIDKDPRIERIKTTTNAEVMEILSKSTLMCYPNIFKETFCAVAMESISVNTPVITSCLGALPETVLDCGVCVKGDPKSEEFQKEFVETTVKLLSEEHREALKLLRIRCAKRDIDSWFDVSNKINVLCHLQRWGKKK